MKKTVLLILLIINSWLVTAQEPEIGISGSGIRPLSSIRSGSSNVVQGSYYVNEEWKHANIFMTQREKPYYFLSRINLKDKTVETRVANNEYYIDWKDINNVDFSELNIRFSYDKKFEELLEVIYSSENYHLMKSYEARIKKANYNPALNTGSNYDEWIIENQFVLVMNGKSIKLKNKNHFNKIFKEEISNTNLEKINVLDEDELVAFLKKIYP